MSVQTKKHYVQTKQCDTDAKEKNKKNPDFIKKIPHHKLTSHTQKPEEEDGEDTEL